MDLPLPVGVREQWAARIEPAPGVSIWQALADANPQGFLRIEVHPDMTATIVLHEERDA